jgi:hypothetical protein
MTLRNLYLGIKDQLPWKRFWHNTVVTGNALGLFHKRSHLKEDGTPKIAYPTKESANKAAEKMSAKRGVHFSNYKCLFCDGYHLGKNRDNKTITL